MAPKSSHFAVFCRNFGWGSRSTWWEADEVCFAAAEKSAEYRIFRVYCGTLFNSLRILIAAGFYLLDKQGVAELKTVLDNLVTFRNYMESVIKTEDLRAAERCAEKEG